MLVLMRCATGENWNFIMSELAETNPIDGIECLKNQSYDSVQDIGPMGCGTLVSKFYFVTFMITTSMIIMNLFVAVVIEGFSSSTKENSGVVTSEDFS